MGYILGSWLTFLDPSPPILHLLSHLLEVLMNGFQTQPAGGQWVDLYVKLLGMNGGHPSILRGPLHSCVQNRENYTHVG